MSEPMIMAAAPMNHMTAAGTTPPKVRSPPKPDMVKKMIQLMKTAETQAYAPTKVARFQ